MWAGLNVHNQLLCIIKVWCSTDITKIVTSKDVWIQRLVFGEYDIDSRFKENLFTFQFTGVSLDIWGIRHWFAKNVSADISNISRCVFVWETL